MENTCYKKRLFLNNSSLPNNFWAEAIETANYLWNRLLTKTKSYGKLILEEKWSNKR